MLTLLLNNCITLHYGNKLQQGGLQLLKQHANQILKNIMSVGNVT